MTTILILLISAFLLSLKGIFVKLAYADSATVDQVLFFRFLISVGIVWLIFCFRTKPKLFRTIKPMEHFYILTAAFFGYYLASMTDLMSLEKIGAAVSRMVLFTYPVFVVILNSILAKRLPLKIHIATILTTQVGIFLALGGFNPALFQQNFYGSLFALLASLFYAIYIIIIARKLSKVDSLTMISLVVSYAFIFISFHFITFNELTDLYVSHKALIWISMIAIFSTALPLTLFAIVVKKIGSNNSVIISAIGPVFVILLSRIILDERLNTIQLLGSSIILISILILSKNIKNNNYKKIE